MPWLLFSWCRALLIFSLLKFCCPFRYTTASCHKKTSFMWQKSLACLLSQASCFSDQLSSTCFCLPLAVVGLIVLSLAWPYSCSWWSLGFPASLLKLISHLAQPVCLNNIEEDAAFLYPTNCRYFLLILFIHIFGRSIHTYFFRCKVSASHISASTRCLILRIFSKTFPSAAHPKNFSCPRVK